MSDSRFTLRGGTCPPTSRAPLRLRALIALVISFLLVVGCAGPRTQLMQQVREDIRTSNFSKAYADYQKKTKNTDEVDKLLNLGLLAYEAGDFATAHKALGEADRLAEERLTKSLSREAASIAVSDRVRAYQGTVFDRAMIHYYRALAFVAENKYSDATIEGRRVAQYLEVNARESKHAYKDDAFLQYFSGSLYESFGQDNDAWISYKKSRKLYEDYYGLSEPDFLCPLTAAAAKKVGAPPEQIENCSADDSEFAANAGHVVIVCEAGQAPPILESNIVFPIMTYDRTRWDSDDDRDRYAWEVYERGEHYQYEESKLKYLLRVAIPYYPESYATTGVTSIAIRDDSCLDVHASLAQPVEQILRQDLRDRMPAIIVRAITRALIKYAAKEAAESAGNKEDKALGAIFGAIVNAAGVLTEAADTRSWETLPADIYVADIPLEPGTHNLRAVFQDHLGGVLFRQDFPNVTVRAGEIVYLRARCTR